jgi:RNA 2',3'-cyclic 3'-phosphodiesterase
MRLFVAAIIPNFALEKMLDVQESLKSGFGNSIRWTKPTAIHLTLKFLGEVPDIKIPAIWKSLEEVCLDAPGFYVDCSKIGVFPNLRLPKVIWLGLIIPAGLFQLQKEMDKSLVHFGIQKEEREFSPHLTLGRVNSLMTNTEMSFLKERITEFSKETITSFKIDKISLIKSDLKPSGPIYTVLNSIILKTVE